MDSPHRIAVALKFLIERCDVTQPRQDRRLNALENQLAIMAEPWRTEWIIDPARDVRMPRATQAALLAWVTESEAGQADAAARLAIYASSALLDETIPAGCVELRLQSLA